MPLLLPGIGDGARLPAAGGNGWVLSPARIENPDPVVLSGDSRQSHRRSGSPSQFAPDPLESGVSSESEQFRTADGVGFEPTNDFHRCRFPRSTTPLGDSQREQLGKQVRNVPGPRRRHRWPSTRTTKSSQTKPRQAKSRPLTRQVRDKSRPACLEMARNGRETKSPLPSPIHAASGMDLERDSSNSASRSLRMS